MTDQKIIDQMADLYKENEWSPSLNDNNFNEVIQKSLIKYDIKKQPKIQYSMIDEYINNALQHDMLYKSLKDKTNYKHAKQTFKKGSIIKFFRLYDDDVSYVGCTTSALIRFLMEKYEFVIAQQKSLLDMFKDVTKVKIMLLQTYQIISDKEPRKLINSIKDELSNEFDKKIDMFAIFESQINLIVANDVLPKSKNWYIYSYTSVSKKSFIWYTDKEYITDDNIDDILLENYAVILDDNKHKLRLIEKIKKPLEIYAQLVTDKYIFDNGVIDNGYNTQYNIFNETYTPRDTTKIYKKIFPQIQKLLVLERDDTAEKECVGFVYVIKINNKSFVDISDNGDTINDILMHIYSTTKTTGKFKKLATLVRTTPIREIYIKCLKKRPKAVSYTHLTLPTNREV